MRRLLFALAVSATAVGLMIPAADAATTPVVSYKGLPNDWWGLSTPCSTGGAPVNYAGTHVTGPSSAPAQQGSLRISESASARNVIGIGFGATPALSSLSAFSGSVYVSGTSSDGVQMVIAATDGSTTDYALSLAVSTKGSWVPFDLTAGPLHWQSSNYQTGAPIASGTSTLSDFVAARPGLGLKALSFEPVSGCATANFYIDNVHYAAGPTDSTVDFEAPIADSFMNGSHPTSVLTRTPVTLSATLSSASQPFTTSQTVELWSKGTGSSTYKLLKTLTTDATTGAVSYPVGPTSTTSYQWRYPARGNNYAPVNAPAFTIITRQRVAISSKPTTTTYRGYATIKGRITPNRSGIVVRLDRIVSGTKVVVASARTTSGGYFTIKAPMTRRGTYSYVVTSGAYAGEAAGQSSSFTIATR